MSPKLAALLGMLAKPAVKKQPVVRPNLPKKPILQRPSTVGGR